MSKPRKARKPTYRVEGFDGSYEGLSPRTDSDARIFQPMNARTHACAAAQVFANNHPPKSVWGGQGAYLVVKNIRTGATVCEWRPVNGQWVRGEICR